MDVRILVRCSDTVDIPQYLISTPGFFVDVLLGLVS